MSGGGNAFKSKGMGSLLGGAAGFAMGGPMGAALGASLGGGAMDSLTGRDKIKVPGAMNRPEWSLSGPDGKLRSDLQLGEYKPQSQMQSQSTLNSLVERANAQGPTQQAQYLQQANQRNMQNSLGQAEDAGRSQMASMAGQMAMRGGLDAGARERMNRSVGMGTMMNKQRIMNDAAGSDLNILAQDEAQKTSMMQALPSQLLAQAGFERGGKQFDIANTLQTVGGKYDADMSAWAANQTAREQAQLANKNRGLLGLGVLGL